MSVKPDITLFSLEGSRAIRIAWLLEELNLPYTLVSSPRAPTFYAPQEFRDKIGTFLGKSPTIIDNGVVIQESGAITEYLCETYDTSHRLLPLDRALRAKVREYVAASEATLLLHAMPIFFARLRIPSEHADVRDAFVEALAPNVQKDLDWLELELDENAKKFSLGDGQGKGLFLVGEGLTAADTMMHVSVQIVLSRNLGTKEGREAGRWKLVERWMAEMLTYEEYKKAVDRTNYNGSR